MKARHLKTGLLSVLIPALALSVAACGSSGSSATGTPSASAPSASSGSSSASAGSSSPSSSGSSASTSGSASGSATSESSAASGSGSAPTSVDAKSEVPADIASKGFVTVGTFPDYPPGQFAQEGSNDLVGWNIDLANALSEELGIKFNMTPTTFDALIPGVLAKRFDFAMAEANITPERRKQVDFVSYLNNGLAILVPKDSDIKSTKLTDLCGLSVGTNRGASPIPLLEAASKECEANGKQAITVKTYNQIAEAILAVKSGRIPVAIGDQQPISYAAKQNATLRLAVGQGFNQTQAGIIFPKGSPMEKPVADALNNLIANGTYQKILDKWGVGSSAVDKAEILPAN